MHKFELFLIKKGYFKYRFDTKTMKYVRCFNHEISTMVNIDHRYFHKKDPVLEHIHKPISKIDDNLLKGEITFGLNEFGKPATLKYPRPNIILKRLMAGKAVIENKKQDDAMNVILEKVDHDLILDAMFDQRKTIKIQIGDEL